MPGQPMITNRIPKEFRDKLNKLTEENEALKNYVKTNIKPPTNFHDDAELDVRLLVLFADAVSERANLDHYMSKITDSAEPGPMPVVMSPTRLTYTENQLFQEFKKNFGQIVDAVQEVIVRAEKNASASHE